MRLDRQIRAALTLLLAGALAAPARAQVIDQAYLGNGNPHAWANSDLFAGQTFRPTANSVAGAGVMLSAIDGRSSSGTLTAQLWSGLPWIQGSTLLSSGSTSLNLAPAERSFFDVFFPAVSVIPGNVYFLMFVTAGTANGAVGTTAGFAAGGYADGGLYWNAVITSMSDVTDPTNWGDYTATEDLIFREFSTRPTTVPEPGTIALLATGLVGIGGARLRSRRKALAPPAGS